MEEEITLEEPNFSTMRRSTTRTRGIRREKDSNVKGNINNNNNNCIISSNEMINKFSDAKFYCYSLLEAMPLPGPTWSTTAPCVLAEPPLPSPLAPIEASLEELLEWGEENNQASSYNWWLGFLESLDDNRSSASEKFDDPFVENVEIEKDSKGISLEESSFLDPIDLSSCPDDWLMIPSVEKDLGDFVQP